MGTWVQSDHSAPLGPGGSLTANLPVTIPPPRPAPAALVGARGFHARARGETVWEG